MIAFPTRLAFVGFLFLLDSLLVYGQSDQQLKDDIDEFVNAIMQCNGVPAANLAVVRNGEIFYTAGYGVKNLATQDPMTDVTLVNIASISKHFTSTTVAKTFELFPSYGWDDTVRSILGDNFYLSDGYRSNKATVRDLLCHRVGLAEHNAIRTVGYTSQELIERLRHLESSEDFRDRHQYNNLMYHITDNIIRQISGRGSWEDLLQESFLDPLSMTNTTFVTRSEIWDQFATAYQDDGGILREISLQVNSNDFGLGTTPGGVASNAVDMAKWIQFLLRGGQAPNGDQLVDQGLLNDTRDHCGATGSMPLFKYPDDPVTYGATTKAMGWFHGSYRDYHMTGHSGFKGGFTSLLTLLPDVDFGVYNTLTGPSSFEIDFINMYVADLLLNETMWLNPDTICDLVDPPLTLPQRNPPTTYQRSAPLSDYEGIFGNFGYGNVSIFLNNTSGGLDFQYGQNMYMYLTQISDTEFTATGYGIYWYQTYNLIFEDVGGGNYDRVIIEFDSYAPATFIRDLDSSTAPPPPQLCG